MRIKVSDEQWVTDRVYLFAARRLKGWDHLHRRQEDCTALLTTYYRNTRRVRKILRAQGIVWERAA